MKAITWDSIPDYDTWGIDEYWSCDQWILWHKSLISHFGKSTANQIWDYAYSKSGNFSKNLDCRTFNAVFRKYVKDNNLQPYSSAGVLSPILQGYGAGSDIIVGAVNTTSNVAKGLLETISSVFTGNTIKVISTIAIVVGGTVAIAYAYKSFKQ